MRLLACIPVVLFALGACSSPGGPYPSLQPRLAEKIDPRIEPPSPINDRPVAPALSSQLSALVDEAQAGEAAFAPAAANAERLVAAAGPAQSESWIAAQQALSAAIAARKPTALALGDIDAVAANALQIHGGISPNDLKAIDAAAAEASEIAVRQTERIAAMQRRLAH
jgi:hypothetical protein